MPAPDPYKRKEALRALLNIVMLEGVVLLIVVAVYLATWNLTYLIGGVVASSLIFAPLLLRWMKEHAGNLRSDPGEPLA